MKNDLLLEQDDITELSREPSIDIADIGVEVHHGVIKLAGHVSSAAKWSAERAAKRVRGVTAVLMDIDVALDEAMLRNTDIPRSA